MKRRMLPITPAVPFGSKPVGAKVKTVSQTAMSATEAVTSHAHGVVTRGAVEAAGEDRRIQRPR